MPLLYCYDDDVDDNDDNDFDNNDNCYLYHYHYRYPLHHYCHCYWLLSNVGLIVLAIMVMLAAEAVGFSIMMVSKYKEMKSRLELV